MKGFINAFWETLNQQLTRWLYLSVAQKVLIKAYTKRHFSKWYCEHHDRTCPSSTPIPMDDTIDRWYYHCALFLNYGTSCSLSIFDISSLNCRLALNFDSCIGSSAVETPVKSQNDRTILNTNLAASSLGDLTSRRLIGWWNFSMRWI